MAAGRVSFVILMIVGGTTWAELPPAANRKVDFRKDIQPVFEKHCVRCHGAEKQEAGLRLDSRDEALNGGDSGPAWAAGDSASSLLVQLVAGVDPDVVMPPDGEALSAEKIGLLRAWIDQGAVWPLGGKSQP